MPKFRAPKKRKNKLRGAAHPYVHPGAKVPNPEELPDPKRPDLEGLKPALLKKMERRAKFLDKIGFDPAEAAKKKKADGIPLGDVTSIRDALASLDPDDTLGSVEVRPAKAHEGTAATSGAFQKVRSNNAKRLVASREIERMRVVMQHPAFQSNPFGAIQEHLKNTLGGSQPPGQPQAKGQEGGKGDKGRRQAIGATKSSERRKGSAKKMEM